MEKKNYWKLFLWLLYYSEERTHTAKHCYGKTLVQTFLESKPFGKEKLLETLSQEQKIHTFGCKENIEQLTNFYKPELSEQAVIITVKAAIFFYI